jgi:tubulin polyglutamylase TTLL5
VFKGDTRLVRSLLQANYFQHTEGHEWNLLWTSGNCKQYLFEGLNQWQKINHFPQSFELTRKDKLALNVRRMQARFGKEQFNFIPDTFVIPDEYNDFCQQFNKEKQLWIVKPHNLSRGRGIYIIDDVSEVQLDEVAVVSKYIANPLLINGNKFDLRIYVLVTSIDPLRIYVFKEGLARFATQKYQHNSDKQNKFMHLTNYSINKKSASFVHCDNLEQDDAGSKWSLSAFCSYLESNGADMDLFWSRIFDIIIKSVLACEDAIFNSTKSSCIHRTNCFELFGYDILID